MSTTPDLGLPFLAASQSQPEVTHNELIVMLQAMLNGVIQVGLNTPPGSPTEGDGYVTGSAPTGLWASWPNRVAIYIEGEWRFIPGRNSAGTIITMGARQEGMRVYDRNTNAMQVWTGAAWAAL